MQGMRDGRFGIIYVLLFLSFCIAPLNRGLYVLLFVVVSFVLRRQIKYEAFRLLLIWTWIQRQHVRTVKSSLSASWIYQRKSISPSSNWQSSNPDPYVYTLTPQRKTVHS